MTDKAQEDYRIQDRPAPSEGGQEERGAAAPGDGAALSAREYLLLVPALALGALAGFGFYSVRWVPGLGALVFALAFALAALCAGRGRLRWTSGNALLLANAALLFSCYGLWANEPMRLLNAPVAAGSLLLALLHLCGAQAGPLGEAGMIGRGLSLGLRSCFRHLGLPFRGAKAAARETPGKVKAIGAGLAIALPLAGVAGLLLASADQVFSGLFTGLGRGFSGEALGRALWNAMESLLLGLMVFSLLYTLRKGQPQAPKARRSMALAPLSVGIALAALNLLYLLFAGIQFAYLFGGAEHAAMQGGWARYARSGFFELVAVALINLGLFLLCVIHYDNSRPIRALCGALLALTALILASAGWRMGLYIRAFGPSLLRLITLWGMGMIACAILAGAARLVWRRFQPFPPLLAVTLASWLLLNLMGPAGRVADWHARAALHGQLRRADTAYLAQLGPDALPALRRLSEAGVAEAEAAIAAMRGREASPWYAQSLSEYMLRRP